MSAIRLTLSYPHLHDSGALLAVFRLTVASGLAVSIVVAFTAISRRHIVQHQQWMIRAYALSLSAATQIFTLGFGQPIFGDNQTSTAWVINLAIAGLGHPAPVQPSLAICGRRGVASDSGKQA